jgi:hypothetical protein
MGWRQATCTGQESRDSQAQCWPDCQCCRGEDPHNGYQSFTYTNYRSMNYCTLPLNQHHRQKETERGNERPTCG